MSGESKHSPHQSRDGAHGLPCGLSRESIRLACLPALFGAAALLSACMPQQYLVEDQAPAPTADPVRSARVAAAEAVRLEPGPPPQPLPRAPAPQQIETRIARIVDAPQEVHDEAPLSEPDVWARIRRQFSIPRPYSTRVQRQADWFRRNHDYFDRVAERARDYLPYIVREAERRGLPLELALLPVIESAFQPFAYSPARASGLWQFIPSTARVYGLRINWWYDGRRDLTAATSAAFDYLEKLHRDFDGDWLLAVAAYNWGEGNLRRARARNRQAGKPLDFWSLKVPRETRTYVPRWLAVCDIVARPGHYGMTLRQVPDEIGFRLVEVEHQIDLSLAAELAEISLDRLYRLNAGYRRWATEPQGPHQLLIPTSNADAFARRVASLPPRQRVTWHHHEVVSGDTLSTIAERYRTSVNALAQHNRLSGTLIRAGDHLLIPKGPTTLDAQALSAEVRRGLSLARSESASTRARRHRVKKGESLWLIARHHGVPIANLVAWNRLDPEVWLMPGQVLELRESSGPSAPAVTASTKRESGRYVVRNGDNLWLIARRQGVSVDDLVAWNRLDPEVWLMPGQIIELRESSGPSVSIPPAEPDGQRHVVRSGDNLWFVARRHRVSVAELRAWNGLDADEWLMPGQILEVRRGPKHSADSHTRSNESYVVRNGDSLWLIARRHSVSAEQLALWNALSIDGVLRPGQTLMVAPPAGAAAAAATNSL